MIKEGALKDPTPGGDIIPLHSPFFDVDENALITGVRALSHLAVDFLKTKQ